MGMRLCLELIATSIQQLHDLEQIALLPIPSSTEIDAKTESRTLNLEDAFNVLRASLIELEVHQQSIAGELDRYRELFDFAPDGYFVTNAHGDITEANRAATLMFGSHPIGQNLENFVYPSYKEQFKRLLGQLQRGQNIKSLDFRMQFPTGQPFDASFTIISIRMPIDGRVTGMRWWIQDITQRKQEVEKLQHSHQRLEIRVAEMNAKLNLMDRQIRVEREEQRRISRNLTRNEAKLRAMMQHSSDIVNILDIDTTIHYCSPALFKTLGYMPEEIIGKKYVKFIHPEDLPVFQNFLAQSVDTLSVSTPIVMRYQHMNGNWIYLESVCCNLLQDANVQGLVINSRDITERKRTESALQESELRLAAIASSMPATLYRLAISSDGTISIPFISDGLIDLVGVLPKYATSTPYQLLDLIHPEDVDQFKALIKAGFDKLATFRHEFRIITIAGEVKWVQNITRYYLTDNGAVFADGVCIDISERGEAESSLQRTNELLRAVIKAVPVAIDIVSPDGKVLLWNAAAENLFAWNNSITFNHSLPNISESQSLELQSAILDTLAGKPLEGFEMAMQLRDSSWINVSISTVLVHDPHGKIIGVLRIIDELEASPAADTDDPQRIQLGKSPNLSIVRSGTEAIANFSLSVANTLLEQYRVGQRNFAGLNLRGAYFVKADLQKADLSGAALNGSNCSHANFQSANLRGADLRGADLHDANLQYADLRGADLRGADLREANITEAIFDDSNLLGALISNVSSG
ncbi:MULTISPECIES: PAS domain S-box protein [Pseudanabaena]|uniref:histidine kinase n=2 Tax=Pseudanabaena TaxID=1152 RepID=L8MW88_9CYAN|nr:MULTISPECIES: PAS domain S-box protein [Pseudanabaena]ELS30725.1 putative PAS/PAC sensor protein [Pseudanabaena biceps PCC 7429]MDG3496997.1 PAS domain S-box protein [Pseudanabaena catenata USMAC16]